MSNSAPPDGSGSSPITDPLGYPGTPLLASGLLTGDVLQPGPSMTEKSQHPRHPVLAIGSNADPAQIRRKLGDDVRLPVTLVHLAGMRIVHSAHVSAPGYVPYHPLQDADAGSLTALLLWLDDAQLRTLDATEPNYRRSNCPIPLTGADEPALATVLPAAGDYDVYVSRWGPLTDRSGGVPLPAGTQPAAYEALAARPWFAHVVPEWAAAPEGLRVPAAMTALRSDPARRTDVRTRLAAEVLQPPR